MGNLVNKCSCCCPQPEGACCLGDFYTQAVISIAGVAAQDFGGAVIPEFLGCDCLNITVVIDLSFDGPDPLVEFVPDCGNLGGRQGILFFRNYRIRASKGTPMWCQNIGEDNAAINPALGIYRLHAFGPGSTLAIAIELQSEFNQNNWTPQGGVNVDRASLNAGDRVPRAMCPGYQRPALTCSEYMQAALEAFGGLPVQLTTSGPCDYRNATVTLQLQ